MLIKCIIPEYIYCKCVHLFILRFECIHVMSKPFNNYQEQLIYRLIFLNNLFIFGVTGVVWPASASGFIFIKTCTLISVHTEHILCTG